MHEENIIFIKKKSNFTNINDVLCMKTFLLSKYSALIYIFLSRATATSSCTNCFQCPLADSQLSQELDKGNSSSGGGDSLMAITFPTEKQKQILYSSSRREEARPWVAGSGIHQTQMSKKKVRSVSKTKRITRSLRSYLFCTD